MISTTSRTGLPSAVYLKDVKDAKGEVFAYVGLPQNLKFGETQGLVKRTQDSVRMTQDRSWKSQNDSG